MVAQLASTAGGVAHAELLGGCLVEATTVEHLARDERLGAHQLAAEVLGRGSIRLQDLDAHAGRQSRASVAVLDDAQLDAGLVGQVLDGLGEGQVVVLLQEGDRIAALAAAEAVVETARGGDVEAGGLLVVEGAQSLHGAPAGIAQRDVLSDHLIDACAFADEGDVLVVDPPSHGVNATRSRWSRSGRWVPIGLSP